MLMQSTTETGLALNYTAPEATNCNILLLPLLIAEIHKYEFPSNEITHYYLLVIQYT